MASAYTSFIPKVSKSTQYRLAKFVTLAKAPTAFFLSCTVTRIPNVDRVGAGVGIEVGHAVGTALGEDVGVEVGIDLRKQGYRCTTLPSRTLARASSAAGSASAWSVAGTEAMLEREMGLVLATCVCF